MARPPKQTPRQGQLAIQNCRRSRQAEETVPSVRMTRATRQRIIAGRLPSGCTFAGTGFMAYSPLPSFVPFAFSSASCVRSSTVAPFLFWLNAKPIKPSTTKTAPATISQCGYCIAESLPHFFTLRPSATRRRIVTSASRDRSARLETLAAL